MSLAQSYSPQAVAKKSTDAPKNYALYQNYPNPFNNSTSISFALPSNQKVTLKIYDNNGRLVTKLADGLFKAGTHYLRWDGTDERNRNVASGVYLYEFHTNNYSSVKKLILLR